MSHPLPDNAVSKLEIWPEGPPSDPAEGRTEKTFLNPTDPSERWVRNIHIPTLTHIPAENPTGKAMLIIPGGGYLFVSIDNEGYRIANRMSREGFDCFILTYRCNILPEDDAEIPAFMEQFFGGLRGVDYGGTEPPNRNPHIEGGRVFAEEDARQAMRYLKANAEALNIDANRIGVVGFSAGGGLAAHLATDAPSECRPKASAPIYPAYRKVPLPADTCPMFLATAADDDLVPPCSTTRLAEACHAAKVPVTLHLYGNGRHGFGGKVQGTLSDRWMDDFVAWLPTVGL